MSELYRDNWFPAGKAKVLQNRVFPLVPRDGGIVEVGSWEGKSTCFIARYFAPRRILAIDPFTGGVADGTAALTEHRDVKEEFLHNALICGKGQIELIATGWRNEKAMHRVAMDSPIAFVYIDGEHTEVEVYDNVLAYYPLMAHRGVISGDDWGNPGVRRGAERAAKHLSVPLNHQWATWWMAL